jgi:hypothetical protein
VRRDGRDAGPVRGQGLVPGRADLIGLVDRDAVRAQAAGEAFVSDVGYPLGCLAHTDEILVTVPEAFIASQDGDGLTAFLSRPERC